jgi:hypothetical protein
MAIASASRKKENCSLNGPLVTARNFARTAFSRASFCCVADVDSTLGLPLTTALNKSKVVTVPMYSYWRLLMKGLAHKPTRGFAAVEEGSKRSAKSRNRCNPS